MKHSLLAALALAAALTTPAAAVAHHHFLQASYPEANNRVGAVSAVKLHFEGKADAHFSTMKLRNLEGAVVAEMTQPSASAEMILPTPELRNGDYLVEYRVLAQDGSVVQGSFEFTVDRNDV
jgi:methionine-rich copper-binding protein CopC